MKKFICLLVGCTLTGLHSVQAADTAATPSAFQLSIELRDGSHVVGQTVEDTLSLHSASMGDMKLSWSGIRSIEYASDTGPAKLTATNGDTFVVQLTADTLPVQTGFGKTELPVKLIRGIKVTSPAKSSAPAESGWRLTIALRDGSQIIGKGQDDALNFHSATMGDLKLTWAGIRSIEYASANSDTARLTATNNDVYEVQFAAPAVTLETGMGKTELPVNLIRSIKVSAMGGAGGGLPSGLVALWSGEGDGNDSVGGNNGVLHGDVSFAPGKVGQAFAFNGINAYVEVPSSANLKFSDAFTVEAWVNFNTHIGSSSATIAAKGQDTESVMDWMMGIRSDHLEMAVNAGGSWQGGDCVGTLTPGVWYHVAMTYDGSSFRGYVNGVLDHTFPVSGTVRATDYSLRIGAYAPVNGTQSKCFFPGQVDELAIYNRALSADEIQDTYAAQK